MGSKVAGNRDQNGSALRFPFPLPVLPNPRLHHLQGMKIRILPNRRLSESIAERREGMAQSQVAGDRSGRLLTAFLTIKRVVKPLEECRSSGRFRLLWVGITLPW